MQNLSKELLKVRCFLPELIAELEKYVHYASLLVTLPDLVSVFRVRQRISS